jgi:DNA-binding NtrC family response regulator
VLGHINQILLVDDDISSLSVLCEVLTRAGYQIVSAQSGYEAMQRVEANVVDLAILDFNLPDTTGLELLQQIKQLQPGVPVIIMSANTSPSLKLDVFEAGAYTFIAKPIKLPQLLQFVSRALDFQQQWASGSRTITRTIQVKRSIFFRWIRIIK